MALPVPDLDDRRFDDLVAEATERLQTHLPELTRLAPGDPMHGFVDLLAWMTETILYRANLIPERQRRVILNMLQIPERPAQPARGIVCVDANPRRARLPALIGDGAQLQAGPETFTGQGELQPTPLQLTVSIKRAVDTTELDALGFSLRDLREQYGMHPSEQPDAFQPHAFELGKEVLSLEGSIDKSYYLALSVPRRLRNDLDTLREELAGVLINIAVAPADEVEAEEAADLTPRKLDWELLSRDPNGDVVPLSLEVVADSSDGGRKSGVVRLRMPRNAALFDKLASDDPMFAGFGDLPPEPPSPVTTEQLLGWIRLSSADDADLPLGYLGLNGLDVVAQGLRQNLVVGVGNGLPDQVIQLPDEQVDKETIKLSVEEDGSWAPWSRVEFLTGIGPAEKVYRLDPATGFVYFGNGISTGKRVPEGRRIRVESYRFGGGAGGNLPPESIKELTGGSSRLRVRHEWATWGGVDAESVEMAERRIPKFLTHRNRAVTRDDFRLLAENNPHRQIGRADVIEGFLPGASIAAAREDVPGAVSVFVRPPGIPAAGPLPKPTRGMLKDVFEYLLQRVVIGTELYVLSPEYVPLAVGVTIDVQDAETETQTVNAARKSLIDYLWQLAPGGPAGEGWPLGAAVRANELLTRVARVPGVRAVNGLSLFVETPGGWQRLPASVAMHLERYQLPELLAVSVQVGRGEPALPPGLVAPASESRNVPAPVIPDVC